jgi:hypothetical protein
MKNLRFIALIISVLFVACSISQKDLARRCAVAFPPPMARVSVIKIDSSHTDTLWQTNETVSYLDTTQCPPSDTGVTVYKTVPCKCPPSPTVTKTVYQTVIETVTVRDSAASYLQHIEIQKLKTANEVVLTKSRFLMYLAFGSLLLAMIFLYILGRKDRKAPAQ